MERLHLVVRGEVQGVGFRYFMLNEARRLGLRGWVRNNEGGTVEVVAEGPRPALDELKRAAERGPRLARVARVDVEWGAATGGLEEFGLEF
ncbi:MAG: acylphosphatase [Candidatus Dormibacterales bacterium]